ncbi:hypothetical protein Goarm_009195 [Gossypium armourianum]|uniref:Uncharacterized protein n=1 Tax=Gossypium armourianum TaxID=34283 RepID=A0A7J9JS30_9ROSI|nr:hypothetical protein [Gossypium armourianum]
MNVVIAPSSIDIGIDCRDRQTGSRATPLQGLLLYSPRPRLRSSSTLRLNSFSSPQPQAKVKSFPAEAVKPLAANSEGRYIVAGGSSGDVYLWELVMLGYLMMLEGCRQGICTERCFAEHTLRVTDIVMG